MRRVIPWLVILLLTTCIAVSITACDDDRYDYGRRKLDDGRFELDDDDYDDHDDYDD